MPEQLEYETKYHEVMQYLKNKDSIVIATTNGNKVAARTVYFVLYESSIYFLTSKAYAKCKQIVKNPNVALCVDHIQIEGIAYSKGHPGLEENKLILETYLGKCPEKEHNLRYVKHKNTVFIEVAIDKISTWNKGGREYIIPGNQTAFRIG